MCGVGICRYRTSLDIELLRQSHYFPRPVILESAARRLSGISLGAEIGTYRLILRFLPRSGGVSVSPGYIELRGEVADRLG